MKKVIVFFLFYKHKKLQNLNASEKGQQMNLINPWKYFKHINVLNFYYLQNFRKNQW